MPRDILSQSEIDSLISALSAGILEEKAPPEKKEARLYDFRRPTKFSKEQLKTLQVIHDNYARTTGNFLAAFLRAPVKFEVVSVTQSTFDEFIFSLPVPTLMTVFNLSADLGAAMLETSPPFAFTLIDLLFGGEGRAPARVREFTEIEITVLRQVIERFLDNLSYAWKGIVQFSPQIESMETNPQFSQVVASSETVAVVTISAQIRNVQGFVNLCFPYIALDRILPNLTAQQWFNQFQYPAGRERPADFSRALGNAEVEVKVILGNARITLEDFLQFQEGDVLTLHRRIGEPLEALVEGFPVFKVHPGMNGRRLAVSVQGWVQGEASCEQ